MYVCLHFLNVRLVDLSFFFFNDTATTEIYTLSLHDALPILGKASRFPQDPSETGERARRSRHRIARQGPWPRAFVSDRKSTRLNSSHGYISYAVFCLKKKKDTRHRHDDHQLHPVRPRFPTHT